MAVELIGSLVRTCQSVRANIPDRTVHEMVLIQLVATNVAMAVASYPRDNVSWSGTCRTAVDTQMRMTRPSPVIGVALPSDEGQRTAHATAVTSSATMTGPTMAVMAMVCAASYFLNWSGLTISNRG